MNIADLFKRRIAIVGVGVLWCIVFSCARHYLPVQPGLDVLVKEKLELIRGKRLGIMSNRTAISSDGRHILDILTTIPEATVTTLFNLEYGKSAGLIDSVEVQVDSTTGITTYTLCGDQKKLTAEMLQSVDALIFDLQDIGTRFSEDLETMILTMEVAAEKCAEFIVLDRPNPLAGDVVEGPVIQPEFKSQLGRFSIPIRHGMTLGELALYINGEGLLPYGLKAKLTVLPMKNWRRTQWFDKTGLQWVVIPSHVPTLEAALLYPGIHLLEGINIAVGSKDDQAYNYIGAPWVDAELLLQKLKSYLLYGVSVTPVHFSLSKIFPKTTYPESEAKQCHGVYLQVSNRNVFRPVSFAIYLLSSTHQLYPDKIQFTPNFDLLVGNDRVRQAVLADVEPKRIIAGWERELNYFKSIRKKYLLYD